MQGNTHISFTVGDLVCVRFNDKIYFIKGTRLRSNRVKHLKRFVVPAFSCCRHVYGIAIYLLYLNMYYFGWQLTYKRFSLYNRYIAIFNRVVKSIEDILSTIK